MIKPKDYRKILSLSLLALFLFVLPVNAKKIKNSFIIKKETKITNDNKPLIKGERILLNDSIDMINYEDKELLTELKKVTFAGYEKEPNSNKESFIFINPTDKFISGFEIKIDYLDMQGRMLHSEDIIMNCEIPPGESRRFDIKSWDTQRTYYYYLGNEPKRVATPFQVKFHSNAIWIK